MVKLTWGYNAAIPAQCEAAWGARAIIDRGSVDVVWDRTDIDGPQAERERLAELLNRTSAGGGWRAEAERLLASGEMRPTDDRDFLLWDGDGLRVHANPRRSGGYLYVCAYLADQ